LSQFLVTGSSDGFVEVWDAGSGKLRTDLLFQQQEAFMMHDSAVLAASISRDSELLVTGSADGVLKVWRLHTGGCVRRFGAAHAASVTSCAFSRYGMHVLSASCDATARVHGLKSGKLLKELRGHASFVNCAAYTTDEASIITAGADGTLRFWDSRTGEPGAVVRLPLSAGDAAPQPLLAVMPLPGGCALVCARGGVLYVVSLTAAAGGVGCVLRALPHARGPHDFVAAAVSARDGFVYGMCADGTLCCFDLASEAGKESLRVIAAHSGDGLGVACHPHRPLVATFGGDGTLKLWKP
jgi:WD40 repeat-containing protein SMU1